MNGSGWRIIFLKGRQGDWPDLLGVTYLIIHNGSLKRQNIGRRLHSLGYLIIHNHSLKRQNIGRRLHSVGYLIIHNHSLKSQNIGMIPLQLFPLFFSSMTIVTCFDAKLKRTRMEFSSSASSICVWAILQTPLLLACLWEHYNIHILLLLLENIIIK